MLEHAKHSFLLLLLLFCFLTRNNIIKMYTIIKIINKKKEVNYNDLNQIIKLNL
jgi:hypothetical protein